MAKSTLNDDDRPLDVKHKFDFGFSRFLSLFQLKSFWGFGLLRTLQPPSQIKPWSFLRIGLIDESSLNFSTVFWLMKSNSKFMKKFSACLIDLWRSIRFHVSLRGNMRTWTSVPTPNPLTPSTPENIKNDENFKTAKISLKLDEQEKQFQVLFKYAINLFLIF